MKTAPTDYSKGFPIQFFPYIEFWEPDFPWRYTPAKDNNNKLRPWLALLVCEKSLCSLTKRQEGNSHVTFNIKNNEEYKKIFPQPEISWRSAHAQGFNSDTPVFSRLLGLRGGNDLNPETEYYAFLVPAFETGRLRGIGYEDDALSQILAQAHAWENTFEKQKQKHSEQPFTFPVYYLWQFTTGNDSFDAMVEKLTPANVAKSVIDIDVTQMGEGLDYGVLNSKPKRNKIGMPTATQALDHTPHTRFPENNGKLNESEVYERFKDLISKSPVFIENKFLISGTKETEAIGDDDPWVVPPVYGASHIMATTIDESENRKNNTPWLSQVNLDVHYRAVAGLGKKTVQTHQEEFVNRAWKQVEAIQSLNYELYQRLLSVNTNKSLRNKMLAVVGKDGFDNNYMGKLMQYFSSLKYAETYDEDGNPITSLSDIMKDNNIPLSFASATFQHLTDDLAKLIKDLDSTSLMENIAAGQIFKPDEHSFYNLPSLQQIENVTQQLLNILTKDIFNSYFSDFFNLIDMSKRPGYMQTNSRWGLNPKKLNTTDNPPYQEGINLSPIPEHHIMYYYNYFNYNKDKYSNVGNIDINYEIMGDFLRKGFHKHSYYGYAYKGLKMHSQSSMKDDFGIKNVVVIEDNHYKRLFGEETFITEISYVYFISKQKLHENYKNNPEIQKSMTFFLYYPTIDLGNKIEIVFESENMGKDICIKSHKQLGRKFGRWSAMYTAVTCYHPQLLQDLNDASSSNANDYGNYIKSDIANKAHMFKDKITGEKRDEYIKNQNDILEYLLTTPDYVRINLDILTKIKDLSIQKFDTPLEYIEFLKESNDPDIHPYLKWWKQLDAAVKELKKKKAQIQKNKSAKKPPKDKKSPEELHAGFEDNETYKRMSEVASAYYEVFFANNVTGKALRDKYIDELLHSKFPILAYPIFPEPTYHYLKMFSEKFILSSIDKLSPDSITALKSNSAFVEAFLCGMNTEMGRELLWREYPTDQRGSYFRKFWDSETDSADIRNENFFDIAPLHTWKGDLGDNHAESKTGLLLFIIKGKLIKQYPGTKVFLHKATGNRAQKTIDFDPKASIENGGIILPVIQAYLKDDIYTVGFKRQFEELVGNPLKGDYGYMLTFEEDVQDLNFENNKNENKELEEATNAASVARVLRNDISLYGKHLSLFITK